MSKNIPIKIKSEVKLTTGAVIIVIGFLFISQGYTVFEISSTFENREILTSPPTNKEDITYHDPADQVKWINEFDIHQLDSDPNIIGNSLGIQVSVSVNEIPKEFAFHIFHADSEIYFKGTEEYHYKAITKKLNSVPSLKYGDIYSVKFDPAQITGEKTPYTLNGFANITFEKPGTYFAQFSAKLQDGTIIHVPSTTSVFSITDGKQEWMIDAIEKIGTEEAINRYLSINSFGWVFVAIGIGLIVSGIPLIVNSFEKRLSLVEQLKKHQ